MKLSIFLHSVVVVGISISLFGKYVDAVPECEIDGTCDEHAAGAPAGSEGGEAADMHTDGHQLDSTGEGLRHHPSAGPSGSEEEAADTITGDESEEMATEMPTETGAEMASPEAATRDTPKVDTEMNTQGELAADSTNATTPEMGTTNHTADTKNTADPSSSNHAGTTNATTEEEGAGGSEGNGTAPMPPQMTESAPQMKMTTEMPEGVTTPNELETSIGKLNLHDGVPDEATTRKVFDNLDLQRGTQALLSTIQIASLSAMKSAHEKVGAVNDKVLIFEELMDSKSLFLTGNTASIYMTMWLELDKEPLVLETPPNVLGFINNAWFQYVLDFGNVGLDEGKGGKYLI
eukprot:Filipodium_phascolosomae@DN2743_c0_g2_i6.p1